MPVTETLTATDLIVSAPFRSEWPTLAKSMGGKYRADDKTWAFGLGNADMVRQGVLELYGELPWNGIDTGIAVEITAKKNVEGQDCRPVSFGGQVVVNASHRTDTPRVGRNARLQTGKMLMAGSHQYWKIHVPAGSVFTLERVWPGLASEDRNWAVRILENSMDALVLSAERSRLLSRVAEIDALISSGRPNTNDLDTAN